MTAGSTKRLQHAATKAIGLDIFNINKFMNKQKKNVFSNISLV